MGGGVEQPADYQPFLGGSRLDRQPMQFAVGESSDVAQAGGQKAEK